MIGLREERENGRASEVVEGGGGVKGSERATGVVASNSRPRPVMADHDRWYGLVWGGGGGGGRRGRAGLSFNGSINDKRPLAGSSMLIFFNCFVFLFAWLLSRDELQLCCFVTFVFLFSFSFWFIFIFPFS